MMLANWADIATMIGTGLAIITVIIAIWQIVRNRQRRALSYAFESFEPLSIDSGSAVKDDLQIFYNGKLVDSLYVTRVGIKNTGGASSSIKRDDLIDPIMFVFKPGTKILREPKVIRKNPENIDIELELESSNHNDDFDIANLKFDILNASWEFVIEFVYTGKKNLPSIRSKIDAVPKMNRYSLDSQRTQRIHPLITLISSFTITLIAVFMSFWDDLEPVYVFLLFAIVVILGYIVIIGSQQIKDDFTRKTSKDSHP